MFLALHTSFVSYRVALTNDPQSVAFECRNSPRWEMTNYLRLVTQEMDKRPLTIMSLALTRLMVSHRYSVGHP